MRIRVSERKRIPVPNGLDMPGVVRDLIDWADDRVGKVVLTEPSQMLHTEGRKLVRETRVEGIGEQGAPVVHPRPDDLNVVPLRCFHHGLEVAELIAARLWLTEMPPHIFAGPTNPESGEECIVLGCAAVVLCGCNEVDADQPAGELGER
jgi:hypothetical protein